MCFLRSLLLAKRLSQPSNSHLNGFSPARGKNAKGQKCGQGPELPRAQQPETERPAAVWPERERRLGGGRGISFPWRKNGKRWLSPLGWGAVVGAGVGQGRSGTCASLCSRAGWGSLGLLQNFPLTCASIPPGPGLPTRGHAPPPPRRRNPARAGQWTGDGAIPFSSFFVPFNSPLSNAAVLLNQY